MTKFEQGQIERCSRGSHNHQYLFYKVEEIAESKGISVIKWITQFSDDELLNELDRIDNDGRLNDYKY